MGMFDSVIVKCPLCSETVEFQSKARGWNSSLAEYPVDEVPLDIALNLNSSIEKCTCGAIIQIKYNSQPKNVKMRVCIKKKPNENYNNIL